MKKNRIYKSNKNNHSVKKAARALSIKRTLALFSFSVFLIAALSISCFSFWSQAQMNDAGDGSKEAVLHKYYTRIEVQYGDTMWDIASRYYSEPYYNYNSYINEIMLINRMLEPELTAGSYIIVPYYSAELIL
ncbi:MAG: LysM peptidoglycan-binding domain-containing protein [Lachnospiraceae bacterium]|nr:LysM peptidoglycan-binding domain-containing protein [Lachnospiraceae bacterium]MDY3223015.1 LysM peptidoglycan-binding domain-containing protein [Lachnospiraceae bacterium]